MKNIIYALILIAFPVFMQAQTCCNRTVSDTPHCSGGSAFQIFLSISSGGVITLPMSNVTYTECSDGTVNYVGTGTASSGDVIQVDITFGSATTVQPSDSPKANACTTTNTSGWTFYTTTTGTITSSQHGIFTVTRMGPSFQVGNNANEFGIGFGASGWFFLNGGNGYYDTGDINFMLSGSCTPVCDISIDAGSPQSTCEGTNVTLSAQGSSSVGGLTYMWSNGLGSGATKVVSPTSTTTYTVTVTDSNNCTETDQITVTVNANPAADAGGDQAVCEGSSATLTATGGNTYMWSNGLGAGAIKTVSPNTTTTYTVTVTNANGCIATDQVIVTVNASPVGNAGPTRTICTGESINLFASASTSATCFGTPNSDICPTFFDPVCGCNGKTYSNDCFAEAEGVYEYTTGACPTGSAGNYSYNWDNGLGLGDSHNVSPTVTTTYNVTITDNDTGCTDVQQVVITVAPQPTVNITIDNGGTTNSQVCSGTAITLTASAGGGTAPYTYTWTATGGNFNNPNIAGPSYTMMTLGVNTLNVFVTDANGCTATNQVDITIIDCCNLNPSTTNATICEGDNTDISASGGDSYLWDTGETTATINVSPTTTTTYSVTISAANCNSDAIEDVTVTVTPLPNVDGGADIFRCIGETSFSTITASGASIYVWNTGDTGSSISVAPTQTTNYTVTGTMNGCSAQDEVTVFIQSCGGGGDTIGVVISADVILGGAGDVGGTKSSGIMMHDKLRAAGLLPLTDPYGLGEQTMPFTLRNRNGKYSVVDWVKIELRDKDDMSVIACKAALLRRDGHLIDPMDENADPYISGVPAGDYYIVVKHRSHGGVMSAAPVPLSDIVTHPCDFTDPNTSTWGNGACYVEDGYMMMYSGNGNGDAWIRATGLSFMNDATGLLIELGRFSNIRTNEYSAYDYNMDGTVRATGLSFMNDFTELLLSLGRFSVVKNVQTPN